MKFMAFRKNDSQENESEKEPDTKIKKKSVTRAWLIIGFILCVIAFIRGYAYIGESSSMIKNGVEDVITTFSDMEAVDFEGNPVTEELFQGKKVTMINMWGTFCNPCIQELPYFKGIEVEYQDQGFQMVGLCLDTMDQDGSLSADQVALAKEIIDKTGANYIQLLPTKSLMDGLQNKVTAFPTTIFVDENGNQIGSTLIVGSRNEEAWKKLIEEKLAEAAAE